MRRVGALLLLAALIAPAPRCLGQDRPPIEIDFSAPMFAKLGDTERATLTDYARHYPRICDFYNNCTIAGRLDSYSLKKPGEPAGEAPPERTLDTGAHNLLRLVYYANGGKSFRLDRWQLDPADPARELKSLVGIITPTRSCLLQRNSQGGLFTRTLKASAAEDIARLRACALTNAPYSVEGAPLEFLLFQKPVFGSKSYVIESVSLAVEEGERVAIVSVSYENARGAGQSEYHLLPERGWVLRRCVDLSLRRGEPISGRLSYSSYERRYGGDDGGMPLLAGVTDEAGTKQGDEPPRIYRREQYTVESLVAGPADPSLFDIDTIAGPSAPADGTDHGRLALVLAGGVAVIVAAAIVLLLVYLRRRRRMS